MGLSPNDWYELAAAAALDALEPEERTMFEDRMGLDAALAGRHGELQLPVALLDQQHETAPPAALRSTLLRAASQRRAQPVEPADADVLFARQVEALVALLAELHEADWQLPAQPYQWTVHGLVAHLLVIEQYTANQLRLTGDSPPEAAHLAMGTPQIEAALREAPHRTAARWAERARATANALSQRRTELPQSLTLHGWPFSLDGAVIARAFELWTHADDIRRAVGRPLCTPEPADLHAMSSFSVSTLPLTLPLVAPDSVLDAARVVLTGPGGSTVDLGHPTTATPATVLVVDVVDYCRVVARRIDPDELNVQIDGDTAIARALLTAASVFAV